MRPTHVSLFPGAQLGPYRITAQIGVGGMGEVWRATDTGLGRQVAIKVLPAAFAHDRERLARFEREARILASLNHPNIAAIYGLEEADGVRALVMELVEGSRLSDRIAEGPLPFDEALPLARQIADALEAAHQQGIVHRDLKPANIMVRPDGTVKVLDFGLAKAGQPADAASPDLSQLPTITSPVATQAGTIVGTVSYMSPEQARGQPADKRGDVWAFGCVLYEMLAARSAFAGHTVADVLGSILTTDPDWSALPRSLPPGIRRLLGRCLQKDPKRRLHDIADARIELEEAEGETGAPVAPRAQAAARVAWVTGAIALVLTAFTLFSRSQTDEPSERRLEITTPPTADLSSFAVSPDGNRIVFVATYDGRPYLWMRELNSTMAQPIAGTAGVSQLCWSPDSQTIAFFAEAKLKRVSIAGGSPRPLQNAPGGGCTWNRNDVIVYGAGPTFPLHRTVSSGGDFAPATRLDPPGAQHVTPSFLPDGVHFLLQATGVPGGRGAYMGSLQTSEIRRLFDADGSIVFVPPDRVVYVQAATLFARQFDLSTHQASETPLTVARGVGPQVSVSSQGNVIAYRARPQRPRDRELTWFSRSGTPLVSVEEYSNHPSISPDGRWVTTWGRAPVGLWILDTTRRAARRLNDLPSLSIWSPDGRRVAFNCGRQALCIQRVDGSTTMDKIWEAPSSVRVVTVLDWSRDGRFLLFKQYETEETNWDLYALPVSEEGRATDAPLRVVAGTFDERDGQFSPDGRWIAYQSNETGRFEIWLRSFPKPDVVVRVTGDGGGQVRWPLDRELFYVAPNGDLMVVPVTPSSGGDGVDVGRPSVLFATTLLNYAIGGTFRQDYAVSRDGQRILMNTEVGEQANPPITLLLNWKAPS